MAISVFGRVPSWSGSALRLFHYHSSRLALEQSSERHRRGREAAAFAHFHLPGTEKTDAGVEDYAEGGIARRSALEAPLLGKIWPTWKERQVRC